MISAQGEPCGISTQIPTAEHVGPPAATQAQCSEIAVPQRSRTRPGSGRVIAGRCPIVATGSVTKRGRDARPMRRSVLVQRLSVTANLLR